MVYGSDKYKLRYMISAQKIKEIVLVKVCLEAIVIAEEMEEELLSRVIVFFFVFRFVDVLDDDRTLVLSVQGAAGQ